MTRATALRRLAPTLAAALAASACGLNQEGVAPPPNTFFYPSSAILDRSGDWLYVTNSNADLRYNDGTLVMVKVDEKVSAPTAGGVFSAAADRAAHWDPCPMGDYVNTPRTTSTNPSDVHFCCWDRIDVNILNCDERAYIPADSSVRIGSFAAGMVRQEWACPLDPTVLDANGVNPPCTGCDPSTTIASDRLYLAVRGDTSLTFVDASLDQQPVLTCASASGNFAVCDDAHRFRGSAPALAAISPDANPASIPLPNEPYALAIDQASGLLFVGHLTGDTSHSYTGGFSLFDVAPRGNAPLLPPSFIAPFPSPFPSNSAGQFGITTFTERTPPDGRIYATSRYVTEVAGLVSLAVCPAPGSVTRDIVASPNGEVYDTSLAGAETRGIAFTNIETPGNDMTPRTFVLQRVPPAVVGFDGTIPTSVLETCSNPTFLYRYAADPYLGDRLFVNCYDTGEIYVFDPSVPRLEATFQVGRGPAGMVFPKSDNERYAYVIGFGDNNLSVVDLQAGSPTEYHVIQRIGFPTEVPR
jgi:DNA-binding beta-propeller fold protein YncE